MFAQGRTEGTQRIERPIEGKLSLMPQFFNVPSFVLVTVPKVCNEYLYIHKRSCRTLFSKLSTFLRCNIYGITRLQVLFFVIAANNRKETNTRLTEHT